MSIIQTSCADCGEPVSSGDSCPHCGADIEQDEETAVELGEEYLFTVEGETLGVEGGTFELTVRAGTEWAELLSRVIFSAEIIACEPASSEVGAVELDSLQTRWCLLEEIKGGVLEQRDRSDVDSLPVRVPLGTTRVDGRPVHLYSNDCGVTLAELVALAERELTVRQVADIFSSVLEGLGRLHEAGKLHLRLSPELVRVKPAGSDEGVPLETDGESGDSGQWGPSGDTEPSHGDGDDESGVSEWSSAEYEETKPQAPLGVRLSEVDADEISSLAAETSPLGDEPSEVDETGIARSNNWIRELGITLSVPEGRKDEDDGVGEEAENEGAYSDSRRDSARLPRAGLEIDLEAAFESISGIFGRDEEAEDIQVVPGFSAPEAYSRGGAEQDAVNDIFSAGMLLYYLVAGRRPPASVYTRHGPALPARNFRPDFPPGLAPVIKRATRPDPEMRYPDIESMKAAFADALEAIEDRTPEKRERLPKLTQAVDRHAGVAKRRRNPVNQDDVFEGTSEDGNFGMMVVADGVSTASYGSGDVASEILIEVGEEVWDEILPAYLMDERVDEVASVRRILEKANEQIVEYVNERYTPFTGSAHEVMGTTGLVAIYHEGTITLGSVGDSRGYLQRGPGLEQLTIDHNLWSLSILEGLPADDALSMPRGDALARCLGTFVTEEGELVPVSPGYDIFRFPVASGDTLLLTTDGLVDFAGGNIIAAEENILATLLAEPEPALACLELILLANRGGGGDNIGLGVARFG